LAGLRKGGLACLCLVELFAPLQTRTVLHACWACHTPVSVVKCELTTHPFSQISLLLQQFFLLPTLQSFM
jgi:hypothetical protein